MGKRKLTTSQIIKIANSYANDCDAVTVAYLSSVYNVSSTTISNALHYAISNCLISEELSYMVAEKAIRHDNLRREQFGYTKNNKVTELYEDLIHSHIQKEASTTKTVDLTTKYNELKNIYDSFDETFSSSDEFPYTKEELEEQLNSIEEQIKKNKGYT